MGSAGGEVRHWNADVNGISLHVAEQGPVDGPAVILLHGFPELWLSWRHQMAALAGRGFRAIAPADAAAYTVLHLVGDVVALLNHLRLPKVFVVGHDWGAQVAWHMCLFRPDMVRAVVAIGIPFFPRGDKPMTEAMAGRDGFYAMQFQEPGRAERAFARYDVATVLKKFYSIEIDVLTAPPGVEIIDFLEARSSPLPWMTDEELGQYAEKFQKSGFTGPLNYYRMFDTDWELTAPWQDAKITVPAKFIYGDKDIGLKSFGTEQLVKSGAFKYFVPNLEVVTIEGHHFLQQEQAEKVNSEILSYFDKFSGALIKQSQKYTFEMAALAGRGFRAIAPDLRGYGDSSAPADAAAYTILHLVGDVVALLNHLRLPKVLVVGHDLGAQVAWHMCLFRPDMVRAVVAIGVPFFPRGPKPMTEALAGRDGFYIMQFQEPGRAERTFARYDVATVLKKFYSIEIDDLTAPPGVEIIDFLEARPSPLPWMTEEELGQYAEKFQKSGFTGPINYYRMFDTSWRLTAPWQDAKITVPAKFIYGNKDIGLKSFGTEQFVKSGALKSFVPNLEVVIIEGHHCLQQEQAERVNSEILSYFDKFTGENT
uniref:AB hydrolase-1 domain-containing protein n=1 Tax=Leersia perrieri TaxID=77586 RepID=A0A0D9Y1T5_9ORYZ